MKRFVRNWAWVGITLLAMVCAIGMVVRHSIWRSDAALKHEFLAHRADFGKLVTMANEDVHLQRIAPDFTWLDTSVAWPRKDVGISEERWNEYKQLFRAVGAPTGIDKDIENSRVFIPIVSEGLVPSGYTKGLVYSPTPLSPVLESLDETPPEKYWEGDHVLAYKPIEGHWYIYYEQW